jgi:ribonuclease HII
MTFPDFSYEKSLWQENFQVIGVDEVGRGCLAGPVYAAAFCVPLTHTLTFLQELESLGINDSKKLTAPKREMIAKHLQTLPVHFAIGSSNVTAINTHGIVKATNQAMAQAILKVIEKLKTTNAHILADGPQILHPDLEMFKQTPLIKGDSLSLSIAAASILAKVARDKYMTELSQQYPHYFWHENKGYGTLTHRQAILNHGVSNHHRTLFVRNILKKI